MYLQHKIYDKELKLWITDNYLIEYNSESDILLWLGVNLDYFKNKNISKKKLIKKGYTINDGYAHKIIDADQIYLCSGIKDKNENFIYKGDVVYMEDSSNETFNWKSKVIFSEGAFRLKEHGFDYIDQLPSVLTSETVKDFNIVVFTKVDYANI